MGRKRKLIIALGALAGIAAVWFLFFRQPDFGVLPQPVVEDGTRPPPEPEPEPEPELVDLRPILQQLPDDKLLLQYPSDEYLALLDRVEMEKLLGTEADFEEAKIQLDQVYDHLQKLKSEPFYRARSIVTRNARTNPLLDGCRLTIAAAAPWVVIVPDRYPRADPSADQALAERGLREMIGLSATVRELIGERLDLPNFAAREDVDQWVMQVILFRTQAEYRAYQEDISDPSSPGAYVSYRNEDHMTVGCIDFDNPEQVAGLRYIGAFQLLHAYSRFQQSKETGEEVPWTDAALTTRHVLTSTGLSWLLACGLEGRQLLRVFREAREFGEEGLPLDVMLDMRTRAELIQRWRRANLHPVVNIPNLFHAKAWSFAHFLWCADDGKYRERFLECVDLELKGQLDPEKFKEVFWKDGLRDVKSLDAEYQQYLERLLAE